MPRYHYLGLACGQLDGDPSHVQRYYAATEEGGFFSEPIGTDRKKVLDWLKDNISPTGRIEISHLVTDKELIKDLTNYFPPYRLTIHIDNNSN